jgi:S-adenosylmethionine:tRNA ribosyltransferase-isomerase
MNLLDFDYHLPKALIAQMPSDKRDHSNLMIVSRNTGQIEHSRFYEITKYLEAGDLLVLNNTKVMHVKLIGRRKTGALIDILLLDETGNGVWEIMINSRGKIKRDEDLYFNGGLFKGSLLKENNKWLIDFKDVSVTDLISSVGNAPLPPYIKRERADNTYVSFDRERYQTIYAEKEGAIAAPTAGLHFTVELIDRIKQKGVSLAYITLHVGKGTFEPIRSDDLSKHIMKMEYYEVPLETISRLKEALKYNKRIIAVGTTVCRTLEHIANNINRDELANTDGLKGWTDLFIYPPYSFKLVKGLITNFHLPKGTPLILASAFGERKNILNAYQEAINNNYRFFSYGDAMFII